MGGKGGSSPDVVGAAKQEGIENRETARDAAYANRPDQYNPFGSLTYQQNRVRDPATGRMVTKWTQKQNLTNPMQNLLDTQIDNSQVLSGMQANAYGRAAQDMAERADFDQFGDPQGLEFSPDEIRSRAEDAAYQRSTSRLDPRFEQQGSDMEIKLRNQGLRPGDEAYDRAMGNFSRSKNDAYEQARLGAVGTGRREAAQMFGQQTKATDMANALRDKNIEEYLSKRSFNLNEANALDPTGKVQQLMQPYGGGGG